MLTTRPLIVTGDGVSLMSISLNPAATEVTITCPTCGGTVTYPVHTTGLQEHHLYHDDDCAFLAWLRADDQDTVSH